VKLSHQTSALLAEVAFLLILIAGIWLAAAETLAPPKHLNRTTVAGILLAIAGLLLIVATHWGQFGKPDRSGEESRLEA
jgi:hypothetical protein